MFLHGMEAEDVQVKGPMPDGGKPLDVVGKRVRLRSF